MGGWQHTVGDSEQNARLRVVHEQRAEAASRDRSAFVDQWLQRVAETKSERELVVLAFRHCHEMVYATAHRITGSRAEAEDVTQSVFEALTRNLSELRDPARVPGFLKTTAVRTSLRYLRKRRWWRSRRAALVLAEAEEATTSGDALATAAVRQLLERLNGEERAAVVLKFVEQHSFEEVARLMGASVSTVQRRLESAKRKVAALVEGDLQLAMLRRMGNIR